MDRSHYLLSVSEISLIDLSCRRVRGYSVYFTVRSKLTNGNADMWGQCAEDTAVSIEEKK
jgi:hypothetical protein